jgi:hypothetical protein
MQEHPEQGVYDVGAMAKNAAFVFVKDRKK